VRKHISECLIVEGFFLCLDLSFVRGDVLFGEVFVPAAKEPLEIVEASFVRMKLWIDSHVPFADSAGVITCFLQHRTD
jgi:hypothetical protein